MGMLSNGNASISTGQSDYAFSTFSPDPEFRGAIPRVTEIVTSIITGNNVTREMGGDGGNLTGGVDAAVGDVSPVFILILLLKAVLMGLVILLSVLGNLLVIVSVIR